MFFRILEVPWRIFKCPLGSRNKPWFGSTAREKPIISNLPTIFKRADKHTKKFNFSFFLILVLKSLKMHNFNFFSIYFFCFFFSKMNLKDFKKLFSKKFKMTDWAFGRWSTSLWHLILKMFDARQEDGAWC